MPGELAMLVAASDYGFQAAAKIKLIEGPFKIEYKYTEFKARSPCLSPSQSLTLFGL